MELAEIRAEFLVLHGEVTELLSEVLSTRFKWTLVIYRWHLRKMDSRFQELFQRFAMLDAQLIQYTKLSGDFGSVARTTATFNLYAAVREAVLAKLSETRAALDSLRRHGHSSGWVVMAVIGLAVAIGLVVGVIAWLI